VRVEGTLNDEARPAAPQSTRRLALRLALGVLAFLAVVVLIVRTLRPELESLGRGFVSHFGLAGMALGTYIADGFHFPIPPQFYMLLAVGSGTSDLAAFTVITAASLLAGVSGYAVARRLSRFPRIWNWLLRVGGRFRHQLEGRNAYRSAVIASLTPVAFSVQCYVSGLYRLPLRPFAVILALRIPKLMLYYYLVKLGWAVF
jgi:membrane protein YqaA with SNARE-associated domain